MVTIAVIKINGHIYVLHTKGICSSSQSFKDFQESCISIDKANLLCRRSTISLLPVVKKKIVFLTSELPETIYAHATLSRRQA